MILPSEIDSYYLDKIRHNPEYNPFSHKFSINKSEKLFQEANEKSVSKNVLDILMHSKYFNERFHLRLTKQLIAEVIEMGLSKESILELFMALLNMQEFLNKRQFDSLRDQSNTISAFDIQNSVEIREENPDNPHNFTAVSETIVELGNLFIPYLNFIGETKSTEPVKKNDSELFDLTEQIFRIINKYYNIKDFYDQCISYNGSIEIKDPSTINFDLGDTELAFYRQISSTVIQNQKMNSWVSCMNDFELERISKVQLLNDCSKNILDSVTSENGYITYKLRERKLEDFEIHVDYLSSLRDYYHFYSKEQLSNFCNLTITDLLRLHAELLLLVYDLYQIGLPKISVDEVELFKHHCLPKISPSSLKEYLLSVSVYNEMQVECFIDLMTLTNKKSANLFASPLLKTSDYFFSFFSLSHPNYPFLVDQWLEQAGETLDKRGKELEKYLKEKLISAKYNGFNEFKLINQNKFKLKNGHYEEIDLLIQTKKSLIIGEVKCVKYPMYPRDSNRILTEIISDASEQLIRKKNFLIQNEEYFSEIYDIKNKTIISVIVLNQPIYSGLIIDGTHHVTDVNVFLSYFRSGKLIYKEIDFINQSEIIKREPYYNSIDEFSECFPSYLKNPPVNIQYRELLEVTDCTHQLDEEITILFKDINPISDERKLHRK